MEYSAILFQEPDILASVTDAVQALYPFLKYNKDLIMDVLRKVSQTWEWPYDLKFPFSH